MQEKVKLYDSGWAMFQHLLDSYEIFKRFRHFQSLYVQMTHMQKIVSPLRLVVIGLRLCKLVLMVGENQIDSSWVDVHLLAEDWHCHGRALYMPTRTAFAPRWGPFGLFRLGSFPQCEIFFIFLFALFVFFFLFSLGLFDSFKFPVFKLFPESFDIKVDWSMRGIRIPVGNDSFNKGNNFRNILSDPSNIVRSFNTKLSVNYN